MKLHTKALLYSLIVFPGAGYFIVNNKFRGSIALTISLCCIAIFMIEAYYKAQIIAQKIIWGELPFDINIIRTEIPLTQGFFNADIIMTTSLCLGLVWIVGCIDCYRIGKANL